MTSAELQRASRDLEVSLALAFPGSLVRVPILADLAAIEAELDHRRRLAGSGELMIIYLCSCGFGTDDPDGFGGHQDEHPDHYQRRLVRDDPGRRTDAGNPPFASESLAGLYRTPFPEGS